MAEILCKYDIKGNMMKSSSKVPPIDSSNVTEKKCEENKNKLNLSRKLNSFIAPSVPNLQVVFVILLFLYEGALGLSCYECENCAEHPAYLNEKVRECPDTSYVSCIKTESKFAHYTVITRSCSRAPALNKDSCSNHVVNIMRARVCLCSTSLCNGIDAFKNAKGRSEFESMHATTGSGSGSVHHLSSIGSSLSSLGGRVNRNDALFHYNGGNYGNSGSISNSIFHQYNHQQPRLNLNILKNNGVGNTKKIIERNNSNRNRNNHQLIYNDKNGLVGITSTASHAQTHSWFSTWLGYHRQQFQMRICIHLPIVVTASSILFLLFPQRI